MLCCCSCCDACSHACHSNFCSSCKAQPYHSGRSCEQQQEYKAARHCRFCTEQLSDANTDAANSVPAFESVCTGDACLQRRELACTAMLACGHPCPGLRDEAEHMSCLQPECAHLDPSLKVCAEDLCSICWTEELGMAPVVKLTSWCVDQGKHTDTARQRPQRHWDSAMRLRIVRCCC